MAERTYKVIELVGVSDKGVNEAIQTAIERAARTLEGLAWFEVEQVRGTIRDGKAAQFQVVLKVGFRILEDYEISGAGLGG